MQMVDGFPRRSRLNWNTRAELAIRDAIHAVEAAGCHELLTEAVTLLGEAKDKVADFVERDDPHKAITLPYCIYCGEKGCTTNHRAVPGPGPVPNYRSCCGKIVMAYGCEHGHAADCPVRQVGK